MLRRAALLISAAALLALAAARLRSRYTRYAVAGESMAPTLHAGDFIVVDLGAYRARPPAPGHLVLAADPRLPSRRLLKRVARVDAGGVFLEGDNAPFSTDSRHFGPVPLNAILGRAACRYWPLRTLGPLP